MSATKSIMSLLIRTALDNRQIGSIEDKVLDYFPVCLHILSGILYKATNMKTVDYANAYLVEPLGIKKHINYLAETGENRIIMPEERKL